MKLRLERTMLHSDFTKGSLYINDKFFCNTLEDTDRKMELNIKSKVYGKTAIGRGQYQVIISKSKRFGKDLLEVLRVDGFEGIRIHAGNTSKHTEGCILVGEAKEDEKDWITNSQATYNKLHQIVEKALETGELVSIKIL